MAVAAEMRRKAVPKKDGGEEWKSMTVNVGCWSRVQRRG
jgi:hypothetical protein